MTRKIYLFALSLFVLLVPAVALAQTDPSTTISTGADAGWDVFIKDGPLWAALLIVAGLLRAFLNRQHWLAQGKVLSGLTGCSMVLAAVLAWHFAGAPASGVLTALFAAYTLVTHSTVPGAQPKAVSPSSSAAAVLAILLLGGLVVAPQIGCSSAKARGVAALNAALDCETSDLKPLVAELLPIATSYVLSITSPDGKSVDTASLKKAWSTVKSDQGRCALATAIAVLAQPQPASSVMAAGLVPDPGALHGAYAAVRAEHGWGETRTSAGVL